MPRDAPVYHQSHCDVLVHQDRTYILLKCLAPLFIIVVAGRNSGKVLVFAVCSTRCSAAECKSRTWWPSSSSLPLHRTCG